MTLFLTAKDYEDEAGRLLEEIKVHQDILDWHINMTKWYSDSEVIPFLDVELYKERLKHHQNRAKAYQYMITQLRIKVALCETNAEEHR